MLVRNVMTKDIVTAKPDDTLERLLDTLAKNNISGCPVVSGSSLQRVLPVLQPYLCGRNAVGDHRGGQGEGSDQGLREPAGHGGFPTVHGDRRGRGRYPDLHEHDQTDLPDVPRGASEVGDDPGDRGAPGADRVSDRVRYEIAGGSCT